MRPMIFAAIALLAPAAHAQSLRLEITGRLESVPGGPSTFEHSFVDVSAHVYFRSDVAPSGQFNDETDFPIEYIVLDMVARGQGRTERIQFSGADGISGRVTSDPSPDSPFTGPQFEFIANVTGAGALGGTVSVTLVIQDPVGFPGASPATLPSDPLDYRNFDDRARVTGAVAGTESFGVTSIWDPGSAAYSAGAFSFRVVEADPPTPAPLPCSGADLDTPFGVLDFSDVVAFLSAFGAGCP